jgi:hypothetical protein
LAKLPQDHVLDGEDWAKLSTGWTARDEGIAVLPSYILHTCRNRKVVMSRLINPIAEMESSLISNRGKKLPLDAGSLIEFLKSFFDRSAGLSVAL